MKKLLVLILALAMAFTLVSCGQEATTDSQTGTTNAQTTTTKAETTTQVETTTTAAEEGLEATVTLYNTTSIDFTSVAISKAGKEQWGENLLTETLKARTNAPVKIKVPLDTEDRQYDVLAKDANGESYEFHYLDLSELTEEGGSVGLAMTEGGDAFAMFSNE